MVYRGIEYDIKMAGGLNQWVWTVHTPRPRQGRTTGARESAERAAKKSIDAWCYQTAEACDPSRHNC
jgi:hypothetical protein